MKPLPDTLRFKMKQELSLIERKYLVWALLLENNNVTSAARLLGISRAQFFRKVKELKLK